MANPTSVAASFTYDALGRSSTTSNPYCTTSDSTYGITTNAYDAIGRVTQVTKQDGSIPSTSYAAHRLQLSLLLLRAVLALQVAKPSPHLAGHRIEVRQDQEDNQRQARSIGPPSTTASA